MATSDPVQSLEAALVSLRRDPGEVRGALSLVLDAWRRKPWLVSSPSWWKCAQYVKPTEKYGTPSGMYFQSAEMKSS
jgi:hypothetical protein